MSRTRIPASLRRLVAERAGYQCEYCRVPEAAVFVPHQPDHIIAEQHGGVTNADNLALACVHCNKHKGPNIASIDPVSRQLTPLFDPRRQVWENHFVFEGVYIRALTPEGRVTLQVLGLNASERIEVRQALIEEGRYL